MSDYWDQYAVLVSDGEMSGPYDSRWVATRELECIQELIDTDPSLAGLTARIVTREVEAGEWE